MILMSHIPHHVFSLHLASRLSQRVTSRDNHYEVVDFGSTCSNKAILSPLKVSTFSDNGCTDSPQLDRSIESPEHWAILISRLILARMDE